MTDWQYQYDCYSKRQLWFTRDVLRRETLLCLLAFRDFALLCGVIAPLMVSQWLFYVMA